MDKDKEHDRIWLQDEETNLEYPGRTWCQDKQGNDDTEYVRVDLYGDLEAELEWLYEHHGRIVTQPGTRVSPSYWIMGGQDFGNYATKREAVQAAMKIEAKANDG